MGKEEEAKEKSKKKDKGPKKKKKQTTDVFRPLTALENEIRGLFRSVYDSLDLSEFQGPRGWFENFNPRVDVIDKKDRYLIKVELPGMGKADIDLHMEENHLVIEGEKKDEHREEGETYHRVETSYGKFRRVVALPRDARPDSIDARFDSGVLQVELKKTGESGSKRKIEIN